MTTQQIDQLQKQIDSSQQELDSLRATLAELQAVAPTDNSQALPESILSACLKAAIARPSRQAAIEGTSAAIATLTERLSRDRAALSELLQQQEHEQRVQRVEAVREQLREIQTTINLLSAQLSDSLLQMRQVAAECQHDDELIQRQTAAPGWNQPTLLLVGFPQFAIPHAVEQNGRFLFENRPLDVHQHAKQADRENMAERYREISASSRKMANAEKLTHLQAELDHLNRQIDQEERLLPSAGLPSRVRAKLKQLNTQKQEALDRIAQISEDSQTGSVAA